jgi:hypothetical protein
VASKSQSLRRPFKCSGAWIGQTIAEEKQEFEIEITTRPIENIFVVR